MEKYDSVVIGGGPGGYTAAIRLGQLGKKVMLVEKNRLGGECLNYGCIPTKTLINTAKIVDKANHFIGHGLEGELRVNLKELKAWKTQVVSQLVNGLGNLCKANKVDVVYGLATVLDSHSLEVKLPEGPTRRVEAESIVLATGSKPVELPSFRFDHQNILHNWDVLELEEVPKSLVIMGGGVVGMEFAFLFAKMGSKVTVIELMDQLLPGMDKEVSAVIFESALNHKMNVFLKAKAVSWTKSGGSLKLRFMVQDAENEVECEKILVSVGRKPDTTGLGLEKIGVKTDQRGFVEVDSKLRTNVENVYAIGDLVAGPMLAHKASRQGVIAAEVIAGLKSEFDNIVIPDATFTDPEVATAGLSAENATKAGYEIVVAKFPFLALGRAVSVGETKGFVKMVVDKPTSQVLGVQVVGSNASDLISEIALAIEMGATTEDLGSTIHPHPTFPEAIMEAAEATQGKAIHMVNRPWRKQ
jgi:dihydrolipoamide dehydrogenase